MLGEALTKTRAHTDQFELSSVFRNLEFLEKTLELIHDYLNIECNALLQMWKTLRKPSNWKQA